MSRSRSPHVVAGLVSIGVMSLVLVVGSAPQQKAVDDPAKAKGKPVAVPANLAGLEIALGLKDVEGTDWSGEITISAGKILSIDIMQGNVKGKVEKAKVEGGKFSVRSVVTMKKKEKKKKDEITRPVLRVTLDAPKEARVKVNTAKGNFDFVLGDLPIATSKTFLDGQARVLREEGALRLTGPDTEDDYPVIARAPDGKLWLAYSEYTKSKGYVSERVLVGNFDELVPSGHGDQIRLKQFDGKEWSAAVDVTEPGLDIWRPTITVDRKGIVHLAWAQQVDGKWDVYYRSFTPAKSAWSPPANLTKDTGGGFNVVAASAPSGDVWLAYQSWQGGRLQIVAAKLQPKAGGLSVEQFPVAPAPANCWSPAIAADSKGNVYIAYDTYEKQNYDVRLAVFGDQTKAMEVASSPRFEARPSLAVDDKDRVWIAYEESDEQWGMDYSTNMFRKIGFDENPGYALYINRTVKVKCLQDGKLMEPAADVQKALAEPLPNNRTLPRLAVDSAGGLWLAFRHHPLPLQAGENWNSYALRYDGKSWSLPRRLAHSDNLMDNRPAFAAYGQGLVAVYSGDGRPVRTLDRKQNDLFAAVLTAGSETHAPELVPDQPILKAQAKPVHPNEKENVARIRNYRLEHQGKKLRLYRGEFHRHTEYSAHRDQDGLIEDSWRYALDAASMDWMGNGDHDNGFHDEYCWWQIQKVTDLFHQPPHFVAVHSYERSVVFPNGHRNVIMPKRGIRPLPRGELKGTPEKGTPDTKILYRYLKHFGGICSSHTSGTTMGTDWRDNDPVVEPVVEIYQGHRHNYEHFGAPRSATKETNIGGYEPSGFVWNAFAKGYKLGFQASSDHVSTHMSYGMVLTDDLSRQGIIDAFKRRHSYAATDNIIVEFRCGKQIMGDIFETNAKPKFDILVLGTAPVTKVSLVRDAKYIHVVEPNKNEVKFSFTDNEAEAGKTSYYYVRIEQRDGNLAWASPMWITYRPK